MIAEVTIIEIEEEIRRRQREKDEVQYEAKEKSKKQWEEIVQEGRDSFWKYCQLKSPGYYSDDKPHLVNLCDTLQAFYEKRIIRFSDVPITDASTEDEKAIAAWRIVPTTEGLENFIICKKIIINMPPRHGKSRTLINFCQWVFGKDQFERVIECSYNDSVAGDFAKYCRDGISEERIGSNTYVFSDFFPGVKIKYGSHSYFKWALDGQHFNYLGAGIGGSITGKGGSILIIDDPIKLAEEAFNEDRLKTIWDWYTGTFLSRGDAEGGEPLEIITMTRWANGDICGRILDSEEKNDWYVFKLAAYDLIKDEMLCESVLSKKRYFELQRKMVPEIFLANYQNETINQKGRLYKSFKTYDKLPVDSNGHPIFDQIKNYTDTADEGDDYLCSINYGVYMGEAYVLDVYYTKDGMEITEEATAKFLIDSKVNKAKVESNNGGRGFARNVKRILWEIHKTKSVVVGWFHQEKNKKARIMTQSSFVQEHIYFPVNWKDKWPDFYHSMTTYLKEGKNKHDDAEDCITGVAENISSGFEFLT